MNAIERLKSWMAERAKFTPPQQQSLDALENHPLMAEWLEYCKAWAQARVWGKNTTPFKEFSIWHRAVLAAYGPDVGIAMDEDGCRLSNGQFYPYPKE